MSRFLSRDVPVGHDVGILCKTIEDFTDPLKDGTLAGTCETGAMFAWQLIRHLLPEVKFVVVRRPRADVLASLAKFGLVGLEEEMARRDAHLDVIAGLPGTLSLTFMELAGSSACKKLFEFCLGEPFDRAWWSDLAAVNIQVDMRARLGKLHENYAQIEALKADIAQRQATISGGAPCPALH